MKQPIKNIISIVLLVFYLAGFCGVHLLKHSCSSCDHSNIQLAQTGSSEIDHQHCICCKHDHTNNQFQEEIGDNQCTICCDYELVYLKNNPTTTLTKQSKAPLTNETVLFIYQNFKFLALLIETSAIKQNKYYLHDPSETDLDLLCTYLC